jgi:hypothetical protein
LKLGWDAYTRLALSVSQKNGSVYAEHGIGRLKRKLLTIQFTKKEIEVMKKVKNVWIRITVLTQMCYLKRNYLHDGSGEAYEYQGNILYNAPGTENRKTSGHSN